MTVRAPPAPSTTTGRSSWQPLMRAPAAREPGEKYLKGGRARTLRSPPSPAPAAVAQQKVFEDNVSVTPGSEAPHARHANNPFAKCSATNLVADGSKLEYDIVCRERGSARGHAVYELSSNAFIGRIAMVIGAKNMTMTEVQHAHRIGECSPAKLGSAGQF
jgi:hypothetical protein